MGGILPPQIEGNALNGGENVGSRREEDKTFYPRHTQAGGFPGRRHSSGNKKPIRLAVHKPQKIIHVVIYIEECRKTGTPTAFQWGHHPKFPYLQGTLSPRSPKWVHHPKFP